MVDSLIRIYPSGYSTFNTVGLGTLAEATEAIVSEERNGEFELQVVYPMTGIHFYDLELGRILTCKTNPYDDDFQPFRIYSISKPMNGQVIINARHISYDLLGHVALPFAIYYNKKEDKIFINDEPTELDEILDAALKHLTKLDRIAVRADEESEVEKRPFTFEFKLRSGDSFPSVERFASQEPSPLRSILGESNESLIATFGGELEFNGYKVILWSSRGTDSGVKIRYGKNMTDIQADGTSATCYTGVFPYYKSTSMVGTTVKIIDDGSGPVVPIPRDEFFDPDFFDTNVNTLPLSLSSSDFSGGKPTAEALRSYAELYIAANKLGQPAFNITVSYQPISDSPEYAAYKSLEAIRLCDKVTVEHATLGIQNSAEVVRVEYNILKNRYDTIELAVNSDVKSITKTISNLRRDTSGAADTAKDAVDAISSAKTEVDEIKGDVEAIGADVDNLNTDVENVKSDVDNVKTDVDDVKTDVENVKTDVTEANMNASEALGVAYNASGRVDEMDMRVGQLEIDVDNASHAAERAENKANKSITQQRYLYSNYKAVLLDGRYEQVKYVLSDGTNYLDLKITPTKALNIKIEIDGGFSKRTDSTESNPTLFGYSKSGTSSTPGKYCSFNDTYLNYGSSINNAWTETGKFVAANVTSVEISNGEVIITVKTGGIETTKKLSPKVNDFTGDGTLYFGADNNNGKARRPSIAKFTKITAGRDYVPAYDPETGKSGMFDMKDRIFYPAEGWTPGDVIENEYPPVPEGARPSSEWDIPSGYTKYWSTRIPAPKANTPYYICREYQCGDGSVYYTDVMEDANNTVLLSWCKDTDAALIDGGMIAANTIAADKIIANDLMANGIETGVLASREFIESGGTRGMAFDLGTGEIVSNGGVFKLSSSGHLETSSAMIGNLYLDIFGNLTGISPDGLTEVLVGSNSLDGDTAKVYVGTKISQGSTYLKTHPLNAVIIKHGRIRILTEKTEGILISKYEIFGSDIKRGTYRYSKDFYEDVGDWREQIVNEEANFGYYSAPSLEETLNDFDTRIRALESYHN